MTRRIGIDFGTSTTVFAYKDYDNKNFSNSLPKLLELGGKVMFPSIIFEPSADSKRIYGFDAEEESRIADGTLYTNFKMDLMSEAKHDKTCELILGYLKYLRDIYVEECSRIGIADMEETWLSYPAAWPEQIQKEMQKMAQEAGFVNVHVQDEPTAAINSVLFQCKEQLQNSHLITIGKPVNILMIDMGAGTTDLVVCRFSLGDKNPVERILSWPPADSIDYFGGREIDDRLTEYCISYCEKHNYFQRDFRKMGKRMSRNIKKWKEGEFFRALQTNRTPPVPEIVESNVPDVLEKNDFQIVDRKSFETVLGSLLETFSRIVSGCATELKKQQNGFDLFEETDFVILTGGNSSWYFIDEYLLGKRKTVIENIGFKKLQMQPERLLRMGKPQQTVAYGLTLNEAFLKNISEQFKTASSEIYIIGNVSSLPDIGKEQKTDLSAKHPKSNTASSSKKNKVKSTQNTDELYYKELKDLEPVAYLINDVSDAISHLGGPKVNTFASRKAALGIGSIFTSKEKKLHYEKARHLKAIEGQMSNINKTLALKQNSVEERKNVLNMLQNELLEEAIKLKSDLNNEGR